MDLVERTLAELALVDPAVTADAPATWPPALRDALASAYRGRRDIALEVRAEAVTGGARVDARVDPAFDA